jgi:hypothetical protein
MDTILTRDEQPKFPSRYMLLFVVRSRIRTVHDLTCIRIKIEMTSRFTEQIRPASSSKKEDRLASRIHSRCTLYADVHDQITASSCVPPGVRIAIARPCSGTVTRKARHRKQFHCLSVALRAVR